MSHIALSVLVCSTHTRYATFGLEIQRQLWNQLAALEKSDQELVEILILTDNKQMMLGQKRNVMVDMAQGDYVVFVDDDDRLEPTYLKNLIAATWDNCDVITFHASVSVNGEPPKICRYSTSFEQDRNTEDGYERLPNHICAVRRSIAAQVSFPNIVYGEDSGYSKLLKPLLRSETALDGVLYHYDYRSASTETQQHLNASLRVRPDQTPLVDVIIPSDAKTPRLAQMTQHTINTCISGANSLPVNVIVLEQKSGIKYDHAKTVFMDRPFNYNHYANWGAQMGFAKWIMVANNDLIFHDGWLHRLLAVDNPVVSPKCTRDIRQAHITKNESGYETAVHFSGWCFMITRELWYQIGGFDEDVVFWCSDDAVIQQVRHEGVAPMIVPGAVVEHIQSVTLKQVDDAIDLTWAQLDIFVQKYGSHRLTNDPRYQRYLNWKAQMGVRS